jgi:hypothetical protein
MSKKFKISFRISPFQEFEEGSLVTYRNENLLEYLKEILYSRSNFFYIESCDWDSYHSNGIDSLSTTTDQLIEIVAYAEEVLESGINISYGQNRLENVIRWQESFNNQESYILEDQKMGIFLEDSIFKNDSFRLVEQTTRINMALKSYKTVRFLESKIPDIL